MKKTLMILIIITILLTGCGETAADKIAFTAGNSTYEVIHYTPGNNPMHYYTNDVSYYGDIIHITGYYQSNGFSLSEYKDGKIALSGTFKVYYK